MAITFVQQAVHKNTFTMLKTSVYIPTGVTQSLVVQKGGVAAYAWIDRKVVMVMASNTQPSTIGSVLQQQKDHLRTPIPCPESVILYNKYMGNVD